tara:strand:+ start:18251 stop:19048 length:798 start_codon:yes stop_codon:yes gene_type:complete
MSDFTINQIKYKQLRQLKVLKNMYEDNYSFESDSEEKFYKEICIEIKRKEEWRDNKDKQKVLKKIEEIAFKNTNKKLGINKNGVDLDKKRIDMRYGFFHEPLALKKISDTLKIDNIYKRKGHYEELDFFIGNKNDSENVEYDFEVKTRKEKYWFGREDIDTLIFGNNKLIKSLDRLNKGLCKRCFILFFMYVDTENTDKYGFKYGKKGVGEKELFYWEIKLDKKYRKQQIKKISKDIYNMDRGDKPKLNVEVYKKYIKHISELKL